MTREEAKEYIYECLDYGEATEVVKAFEQDPCEDVIGRSELLKAIDTWDKFGCDANTKLVPYQDHYIPYIHYDDVVKCIKGMPPVIPQPKTGHWIKYGIPRCGEQHYKCTNCEEYFNFGLYSDYYKKAFKFCPNCGAKMESEDKE